MNNYKNWKLYLDDLRTPCDSTFVVSRNMADAQRLILTDGPPSFISFDHDLGMDEYGNMLPTGYDFVKWLVQMDIDGIIELSSSFTYKVHSQNPVGAKNIRSYLENYLLFKRESIER